MAARTERFVSGPEFGASAAGDSLCLLDDDRALNTGRFVPKPPVSRVVDPFDATCSPLSRQPSHGTVAPSAAVDVTDIVAARVVAGVRANEPLAAACAHALTDQLRHHQFVRIDDERFRNQVVPVYREVTGSAAVHPDTYTQHLLRSCDRWLLRHPENTATHKVDGFYLFATFPQQHRPVSEQMAASVAALRAGTYTLEHLEPRTRSRVVCGDDSCRVSPPPAHVAGDDCEMCGTPLVVSRVVDASFDRDAVASEVVRAQLAGVCGDEIRASQVLAAVLAVRRPTFDVRVVDGCGDNGIDVSVDRRPATPGSLPVAAELWQIKFQSTKVGADAVERLHGSHARRVRHGAADELTVPVCASVSGFTRSALHAADDLSVVAFGPSDVRELLGPVSTPTRASITELCVLAGLAFDRLADR